MVYDRKPTDGRLGAWLRGIREQKGWSRAYVARRSRLCSSQHLSYVELGRRCPSLALLTDLCEFYAISPDEVTRNIEVQGAALSDAEQDRYQLIKAICVLEEDQRYKLHQLLAPMLVEVSRRRERRTASYTQRRYPLGRTTSPEEEAAGHVLAGEVGGD